MINPNQLGRSPFPASASQWALVGLRGGAVAPPFDPTTIAGLKLWLKADAITGKSDGDPVSAWNDSSTNGYNLLASGINPPNFRTNIVNGKPVVRFLSALHNTMVGGGDIGVAQPYSIFVVGKQAAPDSNEFQMVLGQPLTGQSSLIMSLFTNGHFYLYAGTVAIDTIDSTGAFHVFSGIMSGGNATGYIDGAVRFGPVAGGSGAVNVVTLMTNFNAQDSTGDIAEILIYNSALSTTDRQNVEAYLKAKYAIP